MGLDGSNYRQSNVTNYLGVQLESLGEGGMERERPARVANWVWDPVVVVVVVVVVVAAGAGARW